MVTSLLFLILGFFSGILSGLVGLGGGIFIIPALVFLFGFSQHQAQGTTLAVLVPPIGIFAAWVYYKAGYVNISVAGLICLGFFVGGFIGAKIATHIPSSVMERIFGLFLLMVGAKMLFLR